MSTEEIHDNFIKTLEDESPYSMLKKWAAEFRRERESVENYEWPGHPKGATTDENVKLVHSLIMFYRRSLRDKARQKGISFGQFSLS